MSRLTRRLLLVVGVVIAAFLSGFRPIQLGPFEKYRIDVQLRYRFEKPLSQLVPKGKKEQDFADYLMDEFKKSKEVKRYYGYLGTPKVASEHTLVVTADPPTMPKALKLEEAVTRFLKKKFDGVEELEPKREPKGKKPAFEILGLGFFKPKPKINLGLDLQGGTRVVLQCRRAELTYELRKPIGTDMEKRLTATERLARELQRRGFKSQDFEIKMDEKRGQFVTVRTQAKDRREFRRQAEMVSQALDMGLGGAKELRRQFFSLNRDTVKTVVEIIRRRVDKFGVSEPQIYEQGTDRVVVELPGVQKADQALKVIGDIAQLELKLVPPNKYSVETRDEEGVEVVVFTDKKTGKEVPQEIVYNDKDSELIVKGQDIKPGGTSVGYDEYMRPAVNFELNKEGTRRFASYTRRYVQKYIAIWFDRDCVSAPVIKEPIPSGKVQISGGFESVEEARQLRILLDAGSLPVPVSAVWTRTISPNLGRDVLHKSLIAGVAGLILVLIFMPLYYRLPGVLADIALLIYALVVLGIFTAPLPNWAPVLTLPGIVGFILSIGMAIDANVIIFERMKEELRQGKTLRTSIEQGFDRAWTAILDSNVTTLIASAVLYYFGTGPVKGFATTLSIGVLASMFSAIVATRTLLELLTLTRLGQRRDLFLTIWDTSLGRALLGKREPTAVVGSK